MANKQAGGRAPGQERRHAGCLLLASHFRPLTGGAQAVYDALARERPEDIAILTSARNAATGQPVDGVAEFDAAAPYHIARVEVMRPPLLPASPGVRHKLKSRLLARRIRRDVWKALKAELRVTGARTVCIGSLDGLGWLVEPVRRRLGLPVILFTHGEEISQAAYSDKAEDARRTALNAADAVIAVSRFTAGLISEKYAVPPRRVHLLSNGVDFDRFATPARGDVRARFNLGTGPLVLSLGRLVRRKGFDRLLEAWPVVRGAVPGAVLAVAGEGPLGPELAGHAAMPELAGSVRFLGKVPDDVVPALMQAADLFAMPNRTMPDGDTEGFGLVFLEAAAAGTPSVAGNAGGAPDAVRHLETGLLVDGNSPTDIATAIVRILGDADIRASMGKAARDHARGADWSARAESFLSICESLLHTHED